MLSPVGDVLTCASVLEAATQPADLVDSMRPDRIPAKVAALRTRRDHAASLQLPAPSLRQRKVEPAKGLNAKFRRVVACKELGDRAFHAVEGAAPSGVILDIFSRFLVGWLIAPRECSELAQQIIADTVSRHDVEPGMLTLHADRGAAMRSKSVASLLVDLDVAKSHSRPHVSDDNPYSESQFKIMKYRPEFPDRFGCIEDARAHCR